MKKIDMAVRFFILVAASSMVFYTCREEPTIPPLPPQQTCIFLSSEFSNCTATVLKLSITDPIRPQKYELRREGIKIREGFLFASDTTIIDEGLKPSQWYVYQSLRYKDTAAIDTSAYIQIRTMDTTSHAYSWQTFYVGAGTSALYDVFAISDTDVYAVGEYYLLDSTGQINYGKPYNAIHWN